MSDSELSSIEALKARHTKEKKDLQSKITSLKHSVTKNDKKKKKEVQTEVELLEKQLKEKHEKELRDLESNLESTKIADEVKEEENEVQEEEDKPKKLTKTQKQREKKLEAEKKRALAVQMDAERAATSRGTLETQHIKEVLKQNQLRLFDIASDGDCLYNAIAHQLNLNGSKLNGDSVRQKCAEYMRNNSDEFLPFLDEEHANEDGFKEYCLKVEKSCQNGGDWGSATELKAASLALERPIKVINSDGLPHEFGEDFKSDPLVITYHRHLLSLGEHYNSTEKVVA